MTETDAVFLQRLRYDHVINMCKAALFGEMRDTAVATCFLVGGPGDLDHARMARTCLDECFHRDDRGCQPALHVAGSAPVDLPVGEFRPERVKGPSAPGLDHVDVAVEVDALSRQRSFAPRNDIPARMAVTVAGRAFGAFDGCREAGPFESTCEKLADVAIVLARRIDGWDADQFLRQRHKVVALGFEPV